VAAEGQGVVAVEGQGGAVGTGIGLVLYLQLTIEITTLKIGTKKLCGHPHSQRKSCRKPSVFPRTPVYLNSSYNIFRAQALIIRPSYQPDTHCA
jgi:hypothetical protein